MPRARAHTRPQKHRPALNEPKRAEDVSALSRPSIGCMQRHITIPEAQWVLRFHPSELKVNNLHESGLRSPYQIEKCPFQVIVPLVARICPDSVAHTTGQWYTHVGAVVLLLFNNIGAQFEAV